MLIWNLHPGPFVTAFCESVETRAHYHVNVGIGVSVQVHVAHNRADAAAIVIREVNRCIHYHPLMVNWPLYLEW